MDRLPVELIRTICSFLKSRDVGSFRRVSKFYANVGRPIMFRHLHLIFTPHSFERLHAISSNPDLAPYVTSLYYEADTLPVFQEMFDWECNLSDPEFYSKLEAENPLGPDSSSELSDGADGSCQRELGPFTKLKFTHYEKFLDHLKQQDAMREDNYHAGKIADAMLHLPNLEEIIMSLEQWAGPKTKAVRNAYSDCLVVPEGHNNWTEPRGVPQMLSMIQGSARSEIKLKTLWGGVIDWRFFEQSDEILKDLQKAVQNVQDLVLEFSTSPGMEEARDLIRNLDTEGIDELELEIRECAGYLKTGRLKDFLTAAPNLRLLDLRFDSAIPSEIRGFPADLSDVVGKYKWDFLADVTLSFMSSRAEDLIGFCESHAMTLRRLAISKISLVDGSWLCMFQKMRRLLRLQQVRICGHLEALGEFWRFPMLETRGQTTMSRVVQKYLLQGGHGPLLDLNQYTNLNKVELEELKDLRSFYDMP